MSGARLAAFACRETRELWRDRPRLTVACLVPAVLLLVVGFGLSLDVEDLGYVFLDQDATPASRAYLDAFEHSRYFDLRGAVESRQELEAVLTRGEATLAIEIPPGFQRSVARGVPQGTAFWVDGTLPFAANVARMYVAAMHRAWVRSRAPRGASREPAVETRFWFNPGLRSAVSFVPALIAALLGMFPAMVAAMGLAREKETGTIVNLHATPLERAEFLLGKQAPYALLGFVQFGTLVGLGVLVFQVPVRGSLTGLAATALLYSWALTGVGFLVASFVSTQIEALLITMILTMLPAWVFSGVFVPVDSMPGVARALAVSFPTTYFLNASVGVMTKGLSAGALVGNATALLGFGVGFDLVALVMLREQGR